MITVHGSEAFEKATPGCSLALGNFDGVHFGHQAIIQAAQTDAIDRGAASVVFTFEPHPGAVVGRGEPPRLSTQAEKAEFIADLGVNTLLVESFTREYAAQSPAQFVERVLVKRMGVAAVFVGEDFRFGKGRSGDVKAMLELADKHGFTLTAVGAVEVDGERVSSSVIRRLVQQGDVREAARRLTRPYCVSGEVVRGHARGAALGIRTANMAPEKFLIPGRGVYACVVVVDERMHRAVANVGVKPTFGGEDLTLEAHVLDFEADLYGRTITLQFVERLRDEMRFANSDDLVAQIRRDIATARDVLSVR